MEIRYKDKKIRDICENEKKAIKRYNKIIAEKLIFSIEFLKNSNSLKDVADYQNFRLHELGCIINSVDGIKKFYHHYFLIKKS